MSETLRSMHLVLPFMITSARFWCAKRSWDNFQVPQPLTRARVDIAAPILVAPNADEMGLEAKRSELQRALDELDRRGQAWRIPTGRR